MTTTQHLWEELLMLMKSRISDLKIAWYLKEEAINCLKHLSVYKLQNVEKNLNCLCDYLLFLNQQNTEKFLQFASQTSQEAQTSTRNLSYFFFPEKKLSTKATQAYLETLSEQWYHLNALIQGLRGVLVLTIDEFCNASDTRMGIHTMLMKQKTQKEPQKPSSPKRKKTK